MRQVGAHEGQLECTCEPGSGRALSDQDGYESSKYLLEKDGAARMMCRGMRVRQEEHCAVDARTG